MHVKKPARRSANGWQHGIAIMFGRISLKNDRNFKMDMCNSKYSPRGTGLGLILGVSLLLSATGFSRAASARDSLNFSEVYELLKANLAGVGEGELNDAAVRGLLDQLSGKVGLVGSLSNATDAATASSALSSDVFDNHFGYIRVNRLAAGIEREFRDAYQRILSTNTLKGLVVDLRFTGGQDYRAAVALADLFLAAEQPLVDWGEGWKKSSAKTNAISLPVAVLVNRMTTGAAEALAGMLRHRDVGLLLGTNTAGQASMAKEFTLKTGQRLRIAVAPLKVADDKELPFSGIKPDIEVAVDPLDELAWFENAYKVLAKPSVTAAGSTNDNVAALTNRAPRRRLNEADLVRMTREGQSQVRDGSPLSGNIQVKAEDQIPQVVNDPALARAIDLLKGLAVVQQFRSI